MYGRFMRVVSVGGAGAAALLALAAVASANSITYGTVAGSDSDGPLAASVQFTSVAGGIKVTLTNTQTGTIKRGQAVSGLVFTVSGLGTPSAFTEITGVKLASMTIGAGGSWNNSTDGTAFDDTPVSNVADHWKFSTTAANVTLTSAGTGAPGGNPTFMILPAIGTGSASGSSFAQSNFDPYILGPADFFLTVAGVTASTVLSGNNFTGVSVRFGTGPDGTLTANPPVGTPPTVPLPAAAWGGLSLMAMLAGRRVLRKH